MWSDYLKNLRGAEVWKAAQYANTRAVMTAEALTDREGKLGNTSLDKEEMLRHESFPPNDGDHYYELPPAGSTHTSLSKQSSEPCILSLSRRHQDQTSCLLAPYARSGSGTKRGS